MAFTEDNFCWSKKAGDDLTFSRLNSATSSWTRKDLAVAPGRPTQHRQVIEHCLGQITLVPVILQGYFVTSFGKFLPGFVDE